MTHIELLNYFIIKMKIQIVRSIFIMLLYPLITVSKNLYDLDFLLVNYTSILVNNKTVTTSESKNISPCRCDITPDVCDKFCCCDKNCSEELVQQWSTNTEHNLCENINEDDFYSFVNCKQEELIFDYNTNKTILNYRTALNNLLCVLYDNSGIKGRFYRDANTLDSAQLLSIYQSYLNLEEKYYYSQLDTGVNFGIDSQGYIANDYIRVKSNSNTIEKEAKYYFPGQSSNGRCERRTHLKFLNNKKDIYCGVELPTLSIAQKFNWKDNIFADLSFAQFPSNTSPFIKITLNSVYVKDDITKTIKQMTIAPDIKDMPNTEVVIDSTFQNQSECICNLFINELHYNFVVNSDMNALNEIKLDVVLLNNIKGKCSSKRLISQKHSIIFSTGVNELKRSGSPGYTSGNQLLVGQKIINIADNSNYLSINRQGFSISGKNNNGYCVNATDISSNSLFNNDNDRIIYNRNMEYGCYISIPNNSTFADYCSNSKFSSFYIFQQIKNIDYIGIFGSSDPTYLLDWVELKNELSFTSFYSYKNQTCYFPQTLELNILTTKAGSIKSPQEYIISAKFNIIYSTMSFTPSFDIDDSSYVKQINLKFRVNFIQLKESLFTTSKSLSMFQINLPFNLTNPFKSS